MEGVQTVNQFGWAQVAGIAGAALVCLMTLIGILLGIILRRQGKSDPDGGVGQGLIGEVKLVQMVITEEIEDRKTDFASLRKCIDKNRLEEREDINLIHTKIENKILNVVTDFQTMCLNSQQKCVTLQDVKITSVKDKLALTCKSVDDMAQDKRRKWEKQQQLNIEILAKIGV